MVTKSYDLYFIGENEESDSEDFAIDTTEDYDHRQG